MKSEKAEFVANLMSEIRHGDKVTILTPLGQERTGKAVMRSSVGGWVLNMGGEHGTPGLADERNVVKVTKAREPRGQRGCREATALGKIGL